MSDPRQWPPAAGDGAHDDAVVESLLRLAGPREAVPHDRMARLKAAARADWQRHAAAHRRRHVVAWSLGGLSAAAAIILAVRMAGGGDPAAPGAGGFATVEALNGTVQLTSMADGRALAAMNIGDRVLAERDAVTSGTGTATLRLPDGVVLRMPGGASLRVVTADVVELARGAVYVDSSGTTSLEVRTPIGVVRDIGTQFEVRLTPAGLRVRVRAGTVQVRRDRQQHDARRGDELTLDAGGRVTRSAIPVDDPSWAWTTGSASPFELEGRSLREFLDWIAGENGWQLQFADAAVEDKARTTTLHGSIQGLTPEQALAAVLPTSGVEHQLDGGILSIRLVAGVKD